MSSALHPDHKGNSHLETSNSSGNESILDLIDQRGLSRRSFLAGSLSVGALAVFGAPACAGPLVNVPGLGALPGRNPRDPSARPNIGFASVPANAVPMADRVTVPAGYTCRVLISWGDAIGAAPHWDPATAMTEAVQLKTYGAHTDGMHFFPLFGNSKGLLVANNEYNDPGLVHATFTYGTDAITLDMVRTQQAAHGVSIVELERKRDLWTVERKSRYARRITANTPCKVSGPAAGHALMKTKADPSGTMVLGTLNNCAHGHTPWGTYLTCEENWNGYFGTTQTLAAAQTNDEKRYGVTAAGSGYRWHEVDPRFDVRNEPNEPHRFGWVVEIDPYVRDGVPVKRTALGRFKHESATVVVGIDNTVAVYLGDDERNEYMYKFVCAGRFNRLNPRANRDLLDAGTLYVAKFNADGSGQWLPLVWGQNGLTPANGFADQGEVLIKCRQAADRVGATMMDRPEWVAVHPRTREVYLTLTNNNRRGGNPPSSNDTSGTTAAGSARPPVDAVNPRPDNRYGHIIRWRENMGDVAAVTFEWDIFARCGDKLDPHAHHQGDITGDDYGAPDGLWFDKDGRLWIQTDQAGDAQGDWAHIGGNMMLCADPATGETRRFLTSPPNAEVTGVVTTPDGKTMFVGIQHPGEDWVGSFTANSSWPDNGANGPTSASHKAAAKPRSSVVVITKDDGGVIGS